MLRQVDRVQEDGAQKKRNDGGVGGEEVGRLAENRFRDESAAGADHFDLAVAKTLCGGGGGGRERALVLVVIDDFDDCVDDEG